MTNAIIVLAGPVGSGRSVAEGYLLKRGAVLARKFTDRPRRIEDDHGIVFVTRSLLRKTCDVVYQNYTYGYGFNTESIRALSRERPVVVRLGRPDVIRRLKDVLPNVNAVWVEGNVAAARVLAESDERPGFTYKAAMRQRAEVEHEYERVGSAFDFKIVNDRSESWVERQLDAFLLALTTDTRQEALYSSANDTQSPILATAISEALELRLLAHRPDDLMRLAARDFERLVAELLARDGYEVELTPETRDGGFDIIAVKRVGIAVPQLCLVECKRYDVIRGVGVQPVRQLYGVVSEQNASAGLVVTSSFFTKPATAFQQRVGYRLGLRDYEALKEWLARYR